MKERPWAIVTGSTGGIGKAYAYELVAQGFNIVLHGWNKENLERVKKELLHHFQSSKQREGGELKVEYLVLDA